MTKQKFKNDNATIELETKPGLVCIADIQLSPGCTKAEYEKSIKDLGKKASLPGFRKGRVPRVMLVKNFAKDITRSWHENLSHKALVEVLVLASIQILQEMPTLKPKIKKASNEKGATVHLEFEMQPKLTEIDTKGIELGTNELMKIDQEKIDDMVERMRLYFAKWENSKDKELKKGAFVDLDIYNLDDKESLLFKDKRFKLDTKSMASWMYKALEKAKIGDEIESVSKLDKDAEKEMKENFKPTKVKMVVKGIKKAILPDLDDAFAKKVGSKNIEDLLVNAKNILEKQAIEKQRQDEMEQFVEKLLKKYPFEVPKSMLDRQRKTLIDQLMHSLYENPGFEKTIVERRAQIEQNAEVQAEKIIRLHFIVGFVAAKENMRPSQQEIMQYLMGQLPPEELKKLSDPKHAKDRDNYVRDAIFAVTQQKVLHLLIEKIKKK